MTSSVGAGTDYRKYGLPTAVKTRCAKCCVPASVVGKLKKCSGCKVARYCGINCQKNDWARHKPLCRNVYDRRMMLPSENPYELKSRAEAAVAKQIQAWFEIIETIDID